MGAIRKRCSIGKFQASVSSESMYKSEFYGGMKWQSTTVFFNQIEEIQSSVSENFMRLANKLPLFIVTGASCVGKSTLCNELLINEKEYIVIA